jgi:hypothetical protein
MRSAGRAMSGPSSAQPLGGRPLTRVRPGRLHPFGVRLGGAAHRDLVEPDGEHGAGDGAVDPLTGPADMAAQQQPQAVPLAGVDGHHPVGADPGGPPVERAAGRRLAGRPVGGGGPGQARGRDGDERTAARHRRHFGAGQRGPSMTIGLSAMAAPSSPAPAGGAGRVSPGQSPRSVNSEGLQIFSN